MQRIVSHTLWMEIKRYAKNASKRQAAVAYVTQDLVGFRRGDLLVADASEHAVAAGETDAKLLASLHRKGVQIYSCPGLHAKVLLMGSVAAVGSGNLSAASQSNLIEAGLISDSPSVVSGVESFIAQVVQQSELLSDKHLKVLCGIKVVRRGLSSGISSKKAKRRRVSPSGNSTWVVGVFDDRELTAQEERHVTNTRRELANREHCRQSEIDWVRWPREGAFLRYGRPGDRMIQIYTRRGGEARRVVLKEVSVLDIRHRGSGGFVYLGEPRGPRKEMPWGTFKRLLNKLGEGRSVGPNSERRLDPELSDGIHRSWQSAK